LRHTSVKQQSDWYEANLMPTNIIVVNQSIGAGDAVQRRQRVKNADVQPRTPCCSRSRAARRPGAECHLRGFGTGNRPKPATCRLGEDWPGPCMEVTIAASAIPGANAAKAGVKNSDIGAAGPHRGRMSFGYETPAGQVMEMGRRAPGNTMVFPLLSTRYRPAKIASFDETRRINS
jgi:hypothetical protein